MANQLKAGAVLSYVVLGLNTIVGLLYTPYMLRMMGQSEYGLYSLVASVIAYLTILDLGMGNAIVRYTAKFRSEGKKSEQYSMFGMFILLYFAIGIVTFILGLILYYNVDTIFGNTMSVHELDRARIMIILMVINLSISFPLSIFGSIITAYENFIFQKSVQILRILLNTAVMVIILQMGYRALGMVVVISIFNIVTLLINLWYCKFKLCIRINFSVIEWRFLKEIGIYSFYIFINVIIDKIYWSTGQFVLGAFVGTAAVAVFAVAIQLQGIYMSFSSAISGVFLPRVTSMVTNHRSNKEISDLFIKTGRIQYVVMAFILTGFILFGKQFVVIWAGENYIDSYVITLLFFIPLTIPLIQNIGIIILQARNQMKFRSLLYICIAIISLIFQIPLAKHFGGIGCAIAISSALILGQVIGMNIYYYKKQHIDIPKFWLEIIKMSFVPIILCFLGSIIIKYVEINTILKLTLAVLSYAILYIPCFWFLSLNSYERELLSTPLKKIILFCKK